MCTSHTVYLIDIVAKVFFILEALCNNMSDRLFIIIIVAKVGLIANAFIQFLTWNNLECLNNDWHQITHFSVLNTYDIYFEIML